jgi:hypothetical protein
VKATGQEAYSHMQMGGLPIRRRFANLPHKCFRIKTGMEGFGGVNAARKRPEGAQCAQCAAGLVRQLTDGTRLATPIALVIVSSIASSPSRPFNSMQNWTGRC